MQILLLEDDVMIAEIMEIAIRAARRDVELEHFISSSKAHNYVFPESDGPQIDLYILDIRVPGAYTGFELGKIIREKQPEANIVLTSAYQRPATKDEMKALDFEWHPKPWHVFDIQKRVASH
ncbi:MAG: response regulator [Chloroflexota bacterium]